MLSRFEAKGAPSFGMFYANADPKRIAPAFSLWAQMAARSDRLHVSATPETALWLLAGQNGLGDIALLVSNPDDSALQYVVNGLERRSLRLLQVSVTLQ